MATSTVADFERGQRNPVPNNLEAMRAALEAAGVSLPPGGAVAGPPIPIRSRTGIPAEKVAPIRWITESDLENWANTRFGQGSFPELIRRLVLAEAGYHPELHFPSGDSIAMQGWDGETKVEIPSPIIPSGLAGWELGTDKQPKTKADQAYRDRTKNLGHSDPSQTTFVFATPRRWAKKKEWTKAKSAEGVWKAVRAIDAIDLVQWLERLPGVALWFARLVQKVPPGVRTIEDVWKEWSLSTLPPLSVSLVLADRDDTATALWTWLRGEAKTFAVQADSPIEAVAFLYAAIDQYPADYRDFYHSRIVVASNADAARAIANVDIPLIIVLEDSEPGLSNLLVQRGHHVFVTLSSRANEGAHQLLPPIRYTIETELAAMGLPREQAFNLARDSARSLTILRRLVPSAPGYPLPIWATPQKASLVVPAMLAGAWDDSRAADRKVIEELSGRPYEEYSRNLVELLHVPDSPFRKIGAAWKVASPRDAWFRLAGFITASDVTKFTKLVSDVLGSADPRYELEPDERWRASLLGKEAEYSGLIRTGMAEVLVLASAFKDQVKSVVSVEAQVDAVVKRLLGNADAQRWWSLHRQLPVLAEASPNAFLAALDDSLQMIDPPVMKLFAEGKDDLFGGGGAYPNLLWALETLAWSPDYLASVTLILARLARLDPGGRYTNRPHNSLMLIYRLWYPQTSATLDERNVVLNRLRRVAPDVAWKFLLNLYPKSHDTAHDTPVPRWRDFSAHRLKSVSHAEMLKGAAKIGDWLLEDVGLDAQRWGKLIDGLGSFAPELRHRTVGQLENVARRLSDDEDRLVIQAQLRKLLNHHRQFPDSDWSLPNDELHALERLYFQLEPKDPVLRARWLFDEHSVPILHPHEHDWDLNEKEADSARREALEKLLAGNGLEGALALSRAAKLPSLVGRAYAQLNPHSDLAEMFVDAIRTEGQEHWDFAYGAIVTYLFERGEDWAEDLLNRAVSENWGALAVERLLLSFPIDDRFIARAKQIGGAVENAYWTKMRIFAIKVSPEALADTVEHLISVGRARHATHFVGHHTSELPSPLLIKVLSAAVSEPADERDGNEQTMFQHYVTKIFEKLDNDPEVAEAEVAKLEWAYLRLLEHSNRQPKALPKFLATTPQFFVEVLSAAYKGQNDESGLDPNAPDYESKKVMASQAWTLLHTWKHVPGSANGKINGAELEEWVRTARVLCAQADRAIIGDQQIGQVLAHAPKSDNGTWPCREVCELIEITRSSELETGLMIGVANKRGVTTRLPTDGGKLERGEAKMYRDWSEKVRLEFPRTATVLMKIAESYERDAKYHDDDANLQQW